MTAAHLHRGAAPVSTCWFAARAGGRVEGGSHLNSGHVAVYQLLGRRAGGAAHAHVPVLDARGGEGDGGGRHRHRHQEVGAHAPLGKHDGVRRVVPVAARAHRRPEVALQLHLRKERRQEAGAGRAPVSVAARARAGVRRGGCPLRRSLSLRRHHLEAAGAARDRHGVGAGHVLVQTPVCHGDADVALCLRRRHRTAEGLRAPHGGRRHGSRRHGSAAARWHGGFPQELWQR